MISYNICLSLSDLLHVICLSMSLQMSILRMNNFWDFPGRPVVKNPPCNAGDSGLIPGQGTKVTHATGQLSLHALEPARHN